MKPSYTVHIKPSGYNLLVEKNQTLLQAAEQQGFYFSQHSTNQKCNGCKGRLLSGQVSYENLPLLNLTEDERDAGFALFCLAKPLSDLVIHLENVISNTQPPLKKSTYALQSLNKLTPTIYQVLLEPLTEDFLIYRAGQYLEIIHRDSSPRPFSIANAPLDNTHAIELHIRHNKENPYTAALLNELKTTKQLRLNGPLGNCILRNEPIWPIIFVAGGTGFAPIKALLEELLKNNTGQPIYFYWGARIISDFYMHDLVSNWQTHYKNFYYIPVLSAANKNWQGRSGLVHEAVLEDHPLLNQQHVYVSGPTELVFAAWRSFAAHGLDRQFIYSDILDYPLSG